MAARGAVPGDLGADGCEGAKRYGEDDEVCVHHCGAGRIRHVVDQPQLVSADADAFVCVCAREVDGRHAFANGAGQRRADEPEADDRDAGEGQHQAASAMAESAAMTPLVSASVPTEMRSALGRP